MSGMFFETVYLAHMTIIFGLKIRNLVATV